MSKFERLPKSMIAIWIFVGMAVWALAQLAVYADNMSDFGQFMNKEYDQVDQNCNDRGLYSSHTDRWIRAYLDGDHKKSQAEWIGVLKAAKGAKTIHELLKGIKGRLLFLEGPDSQKFVQRGNFFGVLKQIFAESENFLGPKSEMLASIAQLTEWEYGDQEDWPNRLIWCQKTLTIKQAAYNKGDPRTIFALMELADTEYRCGKFDQAKTNAEQVYALAAKYSNLTEQARAKSLLRRLARPEIPAKPAKAVKATKTSLFPFRCLQFISAMFFTPCYAQGGAESAFASLEQGLVRQEEAHDQACCDRGIYSKSYDHWTQAFINGRDAEALKEWGGVLKAAKGAVSMVRLASCACTRLDFLDGDDAEKLDRRGGVLAAIKVMYESTAKIAGGDSEQALSIAHYLSDKYRNSAKYDLSVQYERKFFALKEKQFGANGFRLFPNLMDLADKELAAKDYVHAREHGERALAMAAKCHSVPAQYRARTFLTKVRLQGNTQKAK